MTGHTNFDDEREVRLNTAIAEYLSAVQAAGVCDRQAILRKHPDLADELQSFFDDTDHFHRIVLPLQSEPCEASGVTEDFPPRERVNPLPLSGQFGDYEVIEELARGGMGIVYRATQISLNRPVALKMILIGPRASATDIDRFRREAEAAAQLDHPNVVPIYEVGEHAGQHYFSMKLVDGGDLSQRKDLFTNDPAAAARLVASVADAVHHAHQRGILHRDLKPRNILLDSNCSPLVTDFGLAKRSDGSGDTTHSCAIVGTACYMAPEQARANKSVTTAVDVYSLGAILYELLTGAPPFLAATLPETLVQVMHCAPESPRIRTPAIDRDLETICLKCLEKDPSQRYGSAQALADDLRRWLARVPILARPVGSTERIRRWCRRNPHWAGVIAAFSVLISIFSWQLWSENRDTRRALEGERQARGIAQIHLLRSLYEQARALRGSGTPGYTWETFKILSEASALRSSQPFLLASESAGSLKPPPQSAMRGVAVSSLLTTDIKPRWTQAAAVMQPGISDSGRWAVWQAKDGIRILDLASQKETCCLAARKASGEAVAVDDAGRWLALWQPDVDGISVWDLKTMTRQSQLLWPKQKSADTAFTIGSVGPVSSEIAWSPDSKNLLAVDRRRGQSEPASLIVWDVPSSQVGKILAEISPDCRDCGARYDRSGRYLACSTDLHTVTVWEADGLRKLRDCRLPKNVVGRPDVACNGKFIVVPSADDNGQRPSVVRWDVENDRIAQELEMACDLESAVLALDEPRQRVAIGTRGGSLCLWDMPVNRMVAEYRGAHPFAIPILGWNADGNLLYSWGVLDGKLNCWDVRCPPAINIDSGLEIQKLALSGDGRRLAVAGGREARIRLIDRQSNRSDREFATDNTSSAGLLVFSPDGRQLAEINAYRALVWDTLSGRFVARFERETGLEGIITSAAFSPRNELLTCVISTRTPHVAVRDALSRRLVWQAPENLAVDSAFVAPTGNYVIGISRSESTNSTRLTVLEITSGNVVSQTDVPGVFSEWPAFSADGKWMATLRQPEGATVSALLRSGINPENGADVFLIAIPHGRAQTTVLGPSAPSSMAFSADGRFIAIGYSDGSVQIAQVNNGAEVFQCHVRTRVIRQIGFAGRDFDLAVTDGDRWVSIINMQEVRSSLVPVGLDW